MKILDMANVKMGYGFRSKIEHIPDGSVPVIQPKNITNDGILLIRDTCRVNGLTVKPGHILNEKDVLLATRGRFSSTVYAGQFEEDTIASGSLLVLTMKEGQSVLPEYLALYFNSAKGKQELNRLIERTTIPYLNRSALEQMDIPVPALEKQKKLIALEKVKLRYGQLAQRKVTLLNNIINHQLT